MRTGLLFLNNRYHDPTLGTFISVDPLVTKTGEPYIYGGGNPITYSDPSGLCKGVRQGFCTINGAIRQSTPSLPPPPPMDIPIEPSVSPPGWCGQPPCPTSISSDYIFEDAEQAVAYLYYVNDYYDFAESALNSEELWAHYTTASGKQAVRWKPGVGWVRRVGGLSASRAVTVGNTLKVGGRALVVLGGALEGKEQWDRDDGSDPGVRLFRSTAAGGVNLAGVAGGGAAAGAAASAFCGSTATIGCGGPWGSAAVVGVSSVVGAIGGHLLADVVIERVF